MLNVSTVEPRLLFGWSQVYTALEKAMKTSQSNQLKMLRALLEKETGDVMRKLQAVRRNEVKELAKVHKDKDEVMRSVPAVLDETNNKLLHYLIDNIF